MKHVIGVKKLLSFADVIDRVKMMNEFWDCANLLFDFQASSMLRQYLRLYLLVNCVY
jgi:hypothetical protein